MCEVSETIVFMQICDVLVCRRVVMVSEAR